MFEIYLVCRVRQQVDLNRRRDPQVTRGEVWEVYIMAR